MVNLDKRNYPWFHPAAVAYLASLIGPNTTVLEHGGGGSTIWLAARVKQVYCIESNLAWYNWISTQVSENVTMVYGMAGLDLLQYTGRVDVLLIDGQSETRPTWARLAREFVNPGGVVVFDNSDKPAYNEACALLESLTTDAVTIYPHHAATPIATTFYFMP